MATGIGFRFWFVGVVLWELYSVRLQEREDMTSKLCCYSLVHVSRDGFRFLRFSKTFGMCVDYATMLDWMSLVG